jgi:hypothetical protein
MTGIEEKLNLILKELNEINKIAKENNMLFLERNTMHLISHIQTLLESLKKSETGFSIKA